MCVRACVFKGKGERDGVQGQTRVMIEFVVAAWV